MTSLGIPLLVAFALTLCVVAVVEWVERRRPW
jgi:hypothetical protein